MRTDIDLKVNFADDIIFNGSDIEIEEISAISAIRNAQRRVSASQTDFPLVSEIAAGIESFLQNSINQFTLSNIETAIRSCLTKYELFSDNEFDILFDISDNTKLGVRIKFNEELGISQEDASFSVFINIQNQRSYS